MKQKNSDSNLVTKQDLRKEIKQIRSEIKTSAEETARKLEETMLGVKDILLNAVDSYTSEFSLKLLDKEIED